MAIVCGKCGHANVEGTQFCARSGCEEFLGWHTQIRADTIIGSAAVKSGYYTQAASASVTLAATELVGAPGGAATTTATVYNGGSRVEEFTVAVVGPAAGWASVEPAVLRIYPGDRAECTVSFAPPRHASTMPGRAGFTITVVSSLRATLTAATNGTVDVDTFHALNATLVPQQSRGRGRTVHRVELANDGNVMELVRLTATDPTGTVRFAVPPTEIPIAPGSASIPVAVTPPRRVFGRPRQFPFHIQVTTGAGSGPGTPPYAMLPPTAPLRLDGLREASPLIANWVPKVVTALAAVALAATLVVALRPGSPRDTSTAKLAATLPSGPTTPSPARQTNAPTTKPTTDAPTTKPSTHVPTKTHQNTAPSTAPPVIVTTPLHLIDVASQATWNSGTGTLRFPGGAGDDTGFALIRPANSFLLEDGSAPQYLETHPQWVANGWIAGDFALPAPIVAGEHFQATVGFMAVLNPPSAADATFSVQALLPGGSVETLGSVYDTGSDGQLVNLSVDLTPALGATTLRLRVDAGPSPAQDWASWVDPQIDAS